MGTLLEGDVNGNSQVEVVDFGLLKASFGLSEGLPGYNALADFDRSGQVNLFDFGLLKSNFFRFSPIEVP
ncbi:dockerin type I domain-containing protein [Chloroflexota bacterium]